MHTHYIYLNKNVVIIMQDLRKQRPFAQIATNGVAPLGVSPNLDLI